MSDPATPPLEAPAETGGKVIERVDVHREVIIAQLQVATEAAYQALLFSILPAAQGSVLTAQQAESLAFAKESLRQLHREVVEARRDWF